MLAKKRRTAGKGKAAPQLLEPEAKTTTQPGEFFKNRISNNRRYD